MATILERLNAMIEQLDAVLEEDNAWYCPQCGETNGSPVERYYGQDRGTGYHDVFDGCTLCEPKGGAR